MGRVVQRVMRRLVRGLVMRPVMGLLSLLLLVAIVGGAAALILIPGAPRPNLAGIRSPIGGESTTTSELTHDAPPSTESYLKGNQTFNADMMWSALSSDAQDRFRSRGATAQDLQRQMEAARDQGTKVDEFSYIGGQRLPDGTSMHFYLVLTQGPQSRTDATYIPYIFTLDRAGKIARVQ